MMMINDQASTSHEASSTHNVDAMETYNSSPISYDHQGNYNNIDHHHHHHHHHHQVHQHHDHQYQTNNYPNNLALPAPNTASNDQTYNWSMEDIWSMQLLNSD